MTFCSFKKFHYEEKIPLWTKKNSLLWVEKNSPKWVKRYTLWGLKMPFVGGRKKFPVVGCDNSSFELGFVLFSK